MQSQVIGRARILIADDHNLIAQSIRSLLENSFDVLGIVQDGRQLLHQAPMLKPDVVVLDIGMPLLNGLNAAKQLSLSLPRTKFVFLTMQNDPNLAAAAMDLGVVGYVLKSAKIEELFTAISDVLRGKSYITPSLRPECRAVKEERAKQFSKDLSQREQEVLQLLAEGCLMKEVADILTISKRTVAFHKYQIMSKFNIKNNAELVLFAAKHHLTAGCESDAPDLPQIIPV